MVSGTLASSVGVFAGVIELPIGTDWKSWQICSWQPEVAHDFEPVNATPGAVFRYTIGFRFLPQVINDDSTKKAIKTRQEVFIFVLNSASVRSSSSQQTDWASTVCGP